VWPRRRGAGLVSRRCRDWLTLPFCGLDVVVGEFWRTASGATGPPRSGQAGLDRFPDQAALEFRQWLPLAGHFIGIWDRLYRNAGRFRGRSHLSQVARFWRILHFVSGHYRNLIHCGRNVRKGSNLAARSRSRERRESALEPSSAAAAQVASSALAKASSMRPSLSPISSAIATRRPTRRHLRLPR
jgi:hypothetical protein